MTSNSRLSTITNKHFPFDRSSQRFSISRFSLESSVVARCPPLYSRTSARPGHVRDTFLAALDAYAFWGTGEPEPLVEFEIGYDSRDIPISKACRN